MAQGALRSATENHAWLLAPLFFCDETPMPVLDPGSGRTKICQFWAHAMDDRPWGGPAPPAVAYVFAGGRGKKEIAAQLGRLRRYAAGRRLRGLQVAGQRPETRRIDIRLAFCLAHARRNFVEVFTRRRKSPFAKEVIERIGGVYAIEGRIRGQCADEAARFARRRRSR